MVPQTSEQLLGIVDSSGREDEPSFLSEGENEEDASECETRPKSAIHGASRESGGGITNEGAEGTGAAGGTSKDGRDTNVLNAPPSASSTNADEQQRRRSSSGRYFDAPDVSIKCRRCGEVGHFSYDCVSDTPLIKLCSTCGEPGHSFIQCTNRICYNCGQVGHISNNCSAKRVRGLNRYLHDLLPKIRRHYRAFETSDLSVTRCMSCSEFGHINCVSEEADSKIDIFCPRCGSVGHTLAEHIESTRGGSGRGICKEYEGEYLKQYGCSGPIAGSHLRSVPPPLRPFSSLGSRKKRQRLSQTPPMRKKHKQQHPQNKNKKKNKSKIKKGSKTNGVY